MTAAVEVSAYEAAFASRGEPAWHNLGTVFPEDQEVSTKKMLKLAKLDGWDLRFADIRVDGVDENRHVTGARGVVRTNPFDQQPELLAVVGSRYRIYPNEDTFAFADNITDGALQWETAGSINGGVTVFGSLASPKEIVLDPKGRADKVRDYLLVATSHDGSMPLTAMNTPVRVVCQNTLNIAMRGVKQSFKIRHTTEMGGKVAAAREVLGYNVAYMDKFSELAQTLIETEITKSQFDKIVETLVPAPGGDDPAKAAVTRHEKKVDLIEAIYLGQADGPDTMSTISGTAWGAFNALTEYSDWYRKPRKDDAESITVAASGFDPVTNTNKNRVLSVVKEISLG